MMESCDLLVTGVGGQGTVVASDILAAVGLAAGYDVKKSDILGLAVRGGAVVGHVRWGERVHSPIVPDGRADYLIAFEVLEGLRWLGHLRPEGTVLINQQRIYPVAVSGGSAAYPDEETTERALRAATPHVIRVQGPDLVRELGSTRVLNVVLLGVLSTLLPVELETWEGVLSDRMPAGLLELNLRAFREGRRWLVERTGEHAHTGD